MGNHPTSDCNKHNEQAQKCKELKEVYRIDSQCEHKINREHPKFDAIYDEILSSRNKSQNIINHYLNSCNHVMRYHEEDILNGYLHKLRPNNCDLNGCIMLGRNYGNKFSRNTMLSYVDNKEERSHDIHQMLFFQTVDSMHEYLCHNTNDNLYFIKKRNLIKQLHPTYYNNLTSRYVGINNQTELEEKCIPKTKDRKKQSMNGEYESESMTISIPSILSSDIKSKSDHDKIVQSVQSNSSKMLTQYKNPRKMSYNSRNKNSTYVGCYYPNLKEELQEECRLSKRMWKGFIMKSTQLKETHEIKRIRHKRNIDKSLSTIRVLMLFVYTSYEKFQKKLNELARVTSTANKKNKRKAKKQHSKLAHSFKMLIETVQNYGLPSNGQHKIKTVYRGISILPLFSKYSIICHSPCSTSRSMKAAVSFAGVDNGSVLELRIPKHSIYFDMQYISIYKLEFELLFYGWNSFLCIEQLHCDLGTSKINLTPMVLLEQIIAPPIGKYRNEYKQANNILSKLLNNEYKEEKDNDDISLQKEFQYFIQQKRMLVLTDATLMRLFEANAASFDKKYLDICKIIKVFHQARYLTICHTYNIDIKCIANFCLSNQCETFPNTLRSIEVFHKYNKNELNKVRQALVTMWSNSMRLWEPFFDSDTNVIIFKKDESVIEANGNCTIVNTNVYD